MKFIIATVFLAGLAFAEPPPSNSYLPPPPNRNGGHSQGHTFGAVPEVVAARSLDVHGNRPGSRGNLGGFGHHHDNEVHRNGFGRDSHHGSGSQGKFGAVQGYDHNAGSFGRNSYDEANSEPANYNFGYMVSDDHEGTEFGHHEARQEARAQGEYHVVLPDGKKQTVNYEADERGFKPQISYQDADARSGYDNNAQPNFRAIGRGHYDDARSSGY